VSFERAERKREGSIRFDLFELDAKESQLRRSGVPVDLPPQALRVLGILAERPDELVTRKEIQEALWPGELYGDFDSRLNFAVKKLREALGDDAEQPRYVQTVRNAGYRFIAPVRAALTAEMNMSGLAAPPRLMPANSAHSPSGRTVSSGLIHQSALRPVLVGFVSGIAALGLAQWLLNMHPKPVIEKVSAIQAEQVQEIRIVGRGLGRHAPFPRVGLDTPYLMVGDDTAHWMAAKMDSDSLSDVTVLVQDWSDTLVTIKGFSGMYGQGDVSQGNWRLHPADRLRIRVWNPQHENAGFGECLVIVGGGDTMCSK